MTFDLASLPSAVLDLMLGNSSYSFLAVMLWKTGDSRLHQKLSSGLTYVNLKHSTDAHHSVPLFLTQLRSLRVLKVSTKHHLHKRNLFLVSSLPPTLRRLKIDVFDAIDYVYNIDPESLRPGSESREYITTHYKRGPSRFIDLGTLFPQLDTLQLGTPTSSLRTNEQSLDSTPDLLRMSELQDLAGVPDTVTHLGLYDLWLGDTMGGLKLANFLPPSLRFLDTLVHVNYNDMSLEEIEQDWRFPHLEKISKLNWLGPTPRSVAWLPKTLKSCDFNNLYLKGITLSLALTLPPNLEDLSMNSFDSTSFSEYTGSWVSALPRNLTRLTLHSWRELPFSSKISDLPRTLLVLELNKGFALDELEESAETGTNANCVWPPSLNRLKAPILFSVLPQLPHTLLELELYGYDGDASLDGGDLPPFLTLLHLNIAASLSLTRELPSTLTSLHISNSSGHRTGLSVESLPMLPPTLRRLHCFLEMPKFVQVEKVESDSDDDMDIEQRPLDRELFEYPSSQHIVLPPNLTSLNMEELHCTWFSSLPRNLLYLNIDSLYGVNGVPSLTLFADLPQLLSLTINRDFESIRRIRIPSTSLVSLPRSLKRLYLVVRDYNKEWDPFYKSKEVSTTYYEPKQKYLDEDEEAAIGWEEKLTLWRNPEVTTNTLKLIESLLRKP